MPEEIQRFIRKLTPYLFVNTPLAYSVLLFFVISTHFYMEYLFVALLRNGYHYT